MSDSLGGTTTYAYDPEDRLTDPAAPRGTVYNFGYDGEGRRTSLTSTSGRDTRYEYTNGLLTALRHTQSGVALTDLTYQYGVDAQLEAIVDALDPNKSKFIAYDNLNRLIQVAEGAPGDVALPVEDYAYDEEGNRTASHLSALYASNAHNQLLEDEDYTYAYDERGNRVSRTAKADGAVETYSYDSQNRLVGYASPTTTASYAYDAMERRIAKTVDGDATAYIYDTSMQNPLAHDDIVLEFEAGPTPFLAQRWVHSPSVDEPVGFETYLSTSAPGDGVERAMYADRQGSVLYVTAPATGNVLAAYEYDGYGAITQTQGTLVQPYGYTGREFDPESGLYHYRARSYDPVTGMFVQSDPIGFGSGGFNLMRIADNNPFTFIDPSGLQPSFEIQQTAFKDAANGLATTVIIAQGANLLLRPISDALFQDYSLRGGTDSRANPGDCSLLQQRELQDEVNRNTARACVPVLRSMTLQTQMETRRQNLFEMRKWTRQALARGVVANVCYRGGNAGHQQALVNAMEHVFKCHNFIHGTFGKS